MYKPTAQEIQEFVTGSFAKDGSAPTFTFESVTPTHARIRMQANERHLRPGDSISGPIQMGLVDLAAWSLLLHNLGFEAAASVTSNLNINFLSRPTPGVLVAEASLLKLGKRLSVSEVRLFSEGKHEPVAHATVTYAVIVRENAVM